MKASLMRHGFRVILGLTLWGFGCPSPVEAAEPPAAPGTKAASSDAVKFFETGVQAAKASQWEEAHKAFLAAWQIKAHWQIAANLGRAEFMLGRHREAAEHLSYFIREAKDLSEEDGKQSKDMLAKARANIGTVIVKIDLDGADVLVNGQSLGRAPVDGPVFVDPGRITFEARHEEYASAKVSIDIKAGVEREVKLQLKSSNSPAETKRSIEEITPEHNRAPNMAIISAGVAVGAVSLGLGVGSAIFATIRKSDEDALQSDNGCAKLKLAVDTCEKEVHIAHHDYRLFSNIMLWAFVAAGVSAAGTTAYGLLAPDSKRSASVNATISINKGSGGLILTGAW